MSRWFRVYDDMLDDPKVQLLSPELFKMWMNLLAVASRNAGRLPPAQKLAFALRISPQDVQMRLDDLILAGLIDILPDQTLEPHNWSKRQWKSDDSADRVRKFREKKRECNGDVTVTETAPESESESYTDTDTDLVSSQYDAARAKPEETKLRFDLGSAKTRTTTKGKGDYIRERAEGLGLPVDELWAKSASKKKPAAYFTTLCVDRLRTLHPIIDEGLIRDALWEKETDRYARLLSMIVEGAAA